MADSFGLKIGLEGEKEFKKALADINQSFKVLGSEMKLATSQFDKNDKSVEALAARNKVLRKEIDEQTTKIDTLRKALQNAATSFGENDRRTQNWQIQLNNAEAALNDMNHELDENEKAIKEGGKAAEESGSKFEGFGKVLKTVGVALGAVAVAAGAAAVKLGKEVIAAYADYEQLVGGVDTLFKDSSQEIQRYAANAYKTAGLSANEYMETVTGFSASLIQSLGGDTEKAAKYADQECSVCTTEKSCCAGDRFKAVSGWLFSCVMDGNDANAVSVRKTLELSDDLIVAGVAVSLASGLPNLLHGVNDNQLRVGVFLYEILKLLVKTVSDFVCCRCKMQAGGIRHAVHHKHPALDSLEIILQCKVQNRTLMDFIAPQPLPCADMVGKLRYQK